MSIEHGEPLFQLTTLIYLQMIYLALFWCYKNLNILHLWILNIYILTNCICIGKYDTGIPFMNYLAIVHTLSHPPGT